MTLPTQITWFRIFAIPAVVIAYYLPLHFAHFLSAMIFVLAAITDWLDGYLARSLKQHSKMGAFLDPVADKLLVAVSLVLLVANLSFSLLSFFAMIIIAREILVSALREWLAETGERAKLAVSSLAKVKTAFQLIGIAFLIDYDPNPKAVFPVLSHHAQIIGMLFLLIAVLLTLWSMIIYIKIAWPNLTSEG